MSVVTSFPCDDGAVLGSGTSGGFAPAARRWTLAAAILGTAMAFVDGSVVNVALPAIQHDLDATAAQMQWVVEAYALFLASLLLVGGALGDRLGRRAVFMIGVALFTAASLACALSPAPALLIAARGVQGIGAALLVPGSLSLIGAAYPRSERGGAIGTWSALSGVAAALGPVIGGWLIEHANWTWAFLINLPIGVVLWIVCAWRVPESRDEAASGRVDLRGAALATAGLAGVVFAFIQAPTDGWLAGAVLGSGVAGSLALVGFVFNESRVAAPMVPLRLFANSDFAGANVLTLLLYAALGGGLYFLPLNLIQVQGYGATAAGAAMLPFVAIMFLLSLASGRLVARIGAKPLLVVGPLVAAAGFGLLMRPGLGGSYWVTFLPAIVTLGLGMAVTVAPLTTTVMNAVGSGLSGVASGVNNAGARSASLLAIAVFGVVMIHAFDSRLAALLSGLPLPAHVAEAVVAQRTRLAGIVLPPGLDHAQAESLRQAIGVAFVAGFRQVMALCAGLALLGALSAAWFIGRDRRAEDRR
jgi:EmrB/QacA subfamily drug resistance transporter